MICPDCKSETGHYARHAADNPICQRQQAYDDWLTQMWTESMDRYFRKRDV